MTILNFLNDFNLVNKTLLDKEKEGFTLKESISEVIKEEFLKENINTLELEKYEVEELNKIIKSNLFLSFLHAVNISSDDLNQYVILKYNVRYKRYYKYADFARSLVLSREIDNPKIITQGFAKFYNLGEKGVTEKDIQSKINNGSIAYYTDKLDGTNITVRYINNHLLTNTTGSLSKKINEYDGKIMPNYIVNSEKIILENDNYLNLLKDNPNISFIFEYISNDNVIVVHYDESEYGLKLIGGRYFLNEDGTESRLLTQKELELFDEKYNVNYKGYEITNDIKSLVKEVNGHKYKGQEGVVVYIDDEIYKIKADDYVLVHQLKMKNSLKTSDDLKQFINLLTPLIVNESLDDYIAIYKGNVPHFVTNIVKEIEDEITIISLQIEGFLIEHSHLENKEFFMKMKESNLDKNILNMIGVKKKNADYNGLLITYLTKSVYKKLVDNFIYEE